MYIKILRFAQDDGFVLRECRPQHVVGLASFCRETKRLNRKGREDREEKRQASRILAFLASFAVQIFRSSTAVQESLKPQAYSRESSAW